MKRLKSLTAAFLFSSAAAFAAPFSDVPASHWSYDAIEKLTASGILVGFPDGTYKGNKTLTRFDFGMVTAKMLAHIEQMMTSGLGTNLVTKKDLETLDRLTVEFSDELAIIGVKVTSLEEDMKVAKEDTALLKKDIEGVKDYIAKGGLEKVKLAGDMLVRHSNITHKHDWAVGAFGLPHAGNSDNSLTESLIGLNFKAAIDENISAEVYWAVLDYNTVETNGGQSWLQSAFGIGGIGAGKTTDSTVYIAYLEACDMFRFGGDFLFGRNLFDQGHSLLINNYIDVIRYGKKAGDVQLTLQTIFDRHQGSFNDDSFVDFRGVWNLNFEVPWRSHNLYLGAYMQDEPNLVGQGRMLPLFAAPAAPFVGGVAGTAFLGNTVDGQQTSDKRYDVEFGSKGPIGGSNHWDYDLGFVYSSYQVDVLNTAATAANPWISPEMNGWMGHAAVKWDSHKQWAAKVSYTFADDESAGPISINNDMRYQDAVETPYEDIARGNTWFDSGLVNMYDIKFQAEYRKANSKHYFRFAGDILDEMADTVVNDLNRHVNGQGKVNDPLPASKINTVYDSWNSFGVADAGATVLTFEYRYQLAENTRIRVGYTTFDFTGKAVRAAPGVNSISAGRGLNGDYDYHLFWSEIYSTF